MRLGYARVSTDEQTLTNQAQRLSAAGCEKLFQEKISGVARNRPKLEKLIEQLRKGDALVVTRLDRLARSTSELLRIAEKRAGLQSLDEPWADTTSPSGRMIMTVFAGIAEFERTLILSRTQENRLAAQARGVAFGKPKKMLPDQQELAKELVRDGKIHQRRRQDLQRPFSHYLSEAAIIVPPRSRAVPSEATGTTPTQRDRNLQFIAKHGRAA